MDNLEPAGNSFDYISYTEPGWLANPVALLAAARRWRPMASSTIENFDVDSFQRRHRIRGREFGGDLRGNAENILDVMTDAAFLVGPKSFPRSGRRVVNRIRACVTAGTPVEVVLPSFAGRPHNPAAHRRVAPDLGEAHALQLLANISEAVSEVYAPGLTFTLILDGRAYRPFYGYSDDEGMPYTDGLRSLINDLDVSRRINLVDMHDLLAARADELESIDERIRAQVSRQWSDPLFTHREALIRALRQGTETTPISAALIELYKSGEIAEIDANALLREASSITGERAEHTAFEYAVLLTKLNELDFIDTAFPTAVRGTVHPKAGQYAPRIKDPSTVINPWHGVAVETIEGRILTKYESEIYQDFERYEAIFIAGDEAPFFYRELDRA